MASFSFGAGNARKLARIPVYLLGRLATAIIPRSPARWVFGCAVGVTDGALAVWRAAESVPARVWLVADDAAAAEAERLGIPWLRRDSIMGFVATARAGVVVVTHGLGDVNRYSSHGAFIAQLWHGIPLKRIGLDSPVTTDPGRWGRIPGARRALRWLYAHAQGQIRLIPAASHLVRGRLESAFGLDDSRVPVLGEPRTDVLLRGRSDEREARARAELTAAVGDLGTARAVLYAPTWRDGADDPAIPGPDDWTRLIAVLDAHDAVLLIRSHPLGGGDYAPPAATTRVRRLGSDVFSDVTPLLAGMAVLITDYSSLAFDAALVPVPTVFFAPDEADYARSRGFYGDYRDVAGDDPARSWTDAIAQLEHVLGDVDEARRRADRARDLSRRVHAYHDGGSAQRVTAAIHAALLPAAGPAPREESS